MNIAVPGMLPLNSAKTSAAAVTSSSTEKTKSPANRSPRYSIPGIETSPGRKELLPGVYYDCNDGLRVINSTQSQITVSVVTADTLIGFGSNELQPGDVWCSPLKYYIPYQLSVKCGDTHKEVSILDFAGEEVLLLLPDGGLGDTLAWSTSLIPFTLKHKCHTIAAVPAWYIDLVGDAYKNYDIELITHDKIKDKKPFATFVIGVEFNPMGRLCPIDYRHIGLHQVAAVELGLDMYNIDHIDLPVTKERPIKEKYVCIATHGSSRTKCWNNSRGWYDVIGFLKDNGYRVLAIDRSPVNGPDLEAYHSPINAEDFTGDIPLIERANLITHADFFIGLPSGLSWLAWYCRKPVVLISGFSLPQAEFYTPHRVINYHVCNGCWNDKNYMFDHSDYTWCPKHKGTPRQFECTRAISALQVINEIKKVPTFVPAAPKQEPTELKSITV